MELQAAWKQSAELRRGRFQAACNSTWGVISTSLPGVNPNPENGLRFANPFMRKDKISLQARNLNGECLKVNDLTGNPIEIAAVVVWKVVNTAEALFDVDDYEEYVTVQSELAVRHLAGD